MSSTNKGTSKERMIAKIKATKILMRMQRAALGELEVTNSEIQAARLVLSKVLPDLKAVEQTIKDERKRTKQEITDALISRGIDPEEVWSSVVRH